MRSLALVLAAAAAGFVVSQSANAADMPVKVRPVMAPVFNWTGFYIGGNVGGSWASSRIEYQNPPFTNPGSSFAVCGAPPGVPLPAPVGDLTATCEDTSSFLGGAQVGYNWQFGAFLYGLEADVQWRRVETTQFVRFGDNSTVFSPMGSTATDTAYMRSQQNEFGTFRVRVGFIPTGNWMVYGTGGVAAGNVKHSFTEVLAPGNTCAVPSGTTCRTISDSKIAFGWTIGGGFEYLLGYGWSIAAEYLFVDLGRTELTLLPVPGIPGTTTNFTNTATATFDDRSHNARLKVNYKWGAPPVVP
jgi:outer membrane immunogenic protein